MKYEKILKRFVNIELSPTLIELEKRTCRTNKLAPYLPVLRQGKTIPFLYQGYLKKQDQLEKWFLKPRMH